MDTTKKKPWFKRMEFWGTVLNVLSFSPEIIQSFVTIGVLPDYTLLAKLGLPIGLILTILGLRKGNSAKNLPGQENSDLFGGIRKYLPNK